MSITSEATPKPFLSLCMIVRNEAKHLARCLASAKPYVDEMIVVDTGSEDRTPEIAAEYGAKVSYFEWCDDFAAARNYAQSLVSGEWILILDADEELVLKTESLNLREHLSAYPESLAYSLSRTELINQSDMTLLYTIRLFRNSPDLQFSGRFHEKLQYQNQDLNEKLIGFFGGFEILHYGYGEEQVRKKNVTRNIPILERAHREEGLSLTLLYCLAGMYRDTQQKEKAQACYTEAFERLLPYVMEGDRPEEFRFIPSLLFALGTQLLQQQDYETTMLLCQRGLEWCPSFPPLNYLAGCLFKAIGFPLGAVAYFENCLQMGWNQNYYKDEPFELEFVTTYPAYDLGKAYSDMGNWQEAITAFELALNFDKTCSAAQQSLEQVKHLVAS